MERQMTIRSDGNAPYTSPSAIVQVLEGFRSRGLQTPFTLDVLQKAGVSKSLAPRTMQALALLDLIGDDGMPTEAFEALRKAGADEFKDRFAALLRAAYAEVFSYVDPTQDSRERIRDAFRSYVPVAQQERMVTLFLGLCAYAGITDEEPPRRRAQPQARPRREERKTIGATSSGRAGADLVVGGPQFGSGFFEIKPTPTQAGGHPLIQGLLRELPPVGSAWPREKMNDWLAAQQTIFNLLYKIADSGVNRFAVSSEGGEPN
jgi:Family of unknown function (DUF5343)